MQYSVNASARRADATNVTAAATFTAFVGVTATILSARVTMPCVYWRCNDASVVIFVTTVTKIALRKNRGVRCVHVDRWCFQRMGYGVAAIRGINPPPLLPRYHRCRWTGGDGLVLGDVIGDLVRGGGVSRVQRVAVIWRPPFLQGHFRVIADDEWELFTHFFSSFDFYIVIFIKAAKTRLRDHLFGKESMRNRRKQLGIIIRLLKLWSVVSAAILF